MDLTLLSAAKEPTLVVGFICFLLCAAAQASYVFSLFTRNHPKTPRLSIVYESGLSVHLLLMSAYVLAHLFSVGTPSMEFPFIDVPFSILLWLNAVICIVGIVWCAQSQRWVVLVELAILVLCTPPFMPLFPLFVLLDLVFFVFRTCLSLASSRMSQRTIMRRISTTEALDRLPEGVLYLRGDGRALYMNDTMRSCLVALGLSTDLADARVIWPSLIALNGEQGEGEGRDASGGEGVGGAEGGDGHGEPTSVRINVRLGETRLFTTEEAQLGATPCTCIIAYDITEEDELRMEIARANDQLAQTAEQLRASLADIGEIADNEALLHMRSHVHDIIGQRLSILHRYLEDGDVSDDKLAQIEPLLTGMLDELATSAHANSAPNTDTADLAHVINAFQVIGLEFHVEGTLPREQEIARAFTRIVREASTNAVRHGQATIMYVTIGRGIGSWRLTITNNGSVPADMPSDGSGLRGMRNTVADLGGTLELKLEPRFTIIANVPVGEE